MLGLLEYWRKEARGSYSRVPESDGVTKEEPHRPSRSGFWRSILQKIYQVAPFLLLLNLIVAGVWTAQELSHIFARSRSFAPTFFEENSIFIAPPSPESDAAWEDLRPKGGGAVAIANAEAYGLKPGIPIDTGPDVYSISMFHQLHCLVCLSGVIEPADASFSLADILQSLVRTNYYAALNGTIPPPAHQPGIDLLSKEKQNMLQRAHIAHCFDYVRQGIMCAGDMTIESPNVPPDEWFEGISEDLLREQFGDQKPVFVDGWGIKHQCRSFDEAKDWVSRNRVPDDAGLVL
ncbi:hypothetical protein BDR22DRAFT_912065 [Usnea florida]